MNPNVELLKNDDVLKFTLSGVDHSIANALRRILLSDIPMVVFKTTPHEENECTIHSNTSRFNNEIIKQRLSCIPIHVTNPEILKDHILEVNVENNGDSTLYVTTKDFVIKNKNTGQAIPESSVREIFPPFESSKGPYYILFLRLRPKLSDEIPGEKIHLTCTFSIGTCKENGMYNAVSTCAYAFTPDQSKIEAKLLSLVAGWKAEGKSAEEIDFESSNWLLLDAKRITKKESFDFILESVGVYTNKQLLELASSIMLQKLNQLLVSVETDKISILLNKEVTSKNTYDIILEGDDYTVGKVIEYVLYTNYFGPNKKLSFCSSKKMHPHDPDVILRLTYLNDTDINIVKQNLIESIKQAYKVFEDMKTKFRKIIV